MSDSEVLNEGDLADIIRENVSNSNENVIEEAYITGDDRIASASDLQKELIRGSMSCFDTDRIHKEVQNSALLDVMKSVDGSTQNVDELGQQYVSMSATKVVEPPYPPELLAAFLEVDSTHFRCVKTKAVDAVGREYSVEPTVNVVSDDESARLVDFADTMETGIPQYNQSHVEVEADKVKSFIAGANELIGFEGVPIIDRGFEPSSTFLA